MAETHRFRVADREKGRRLDKFLAEKFPQVSRSVLSRFIEDGLARVDGKTASKALKLRAEQEVIFQLPALTDAQSEILPEAMPLDILHEDEDVVVINKPPGLCVHPAPGHWRGTLVNGLLARYPQMAYIGSTRRPGIVHRLDLDTSGALVVALTPLAYQRLIRMMKARAIKREYLAVVHGIPQAGAATINAPIGRDPEHRRRFAIAGIAARPAVTHFEILERFANASLLKVRLDTGRTHQIRVHMKSLGHPVCGDAMYAPERAPLPIKRQALHAHTLAFPHPRTSQPVSCTAPLPEDIRELLDFLRRR